MNVNTFCSKSACDREFIEVYDGPSSWFPLIGRFCNHNNVPDITSTGKDLLLIFTSGPDVPPYDHRGFHASVQGITKGLNELASMLSSAFTSYELFFCNQTRSSETCDLNDSWFLTCNNEHCQHH